MALTDKEVERALKNAGAIWRPKELGAHDVHSLNGLTIAFVEKFKPHFAGIAKLKAPRITTHMVLMKAPDMNAFATRVGLDYAIGINKGLIERVRSTFYSDQVRTFAQQRFPALDSIDPDLLSLTATYFSIIFVFYHEFSHVIKGHLGYLDKVQLNEADRLDMAGQTMTPKQTRARYLVECHADTHGGYFGGLAVWEQIEKAFNANSAASQAVLAKEMIGLASFALGLFFRIMESTEQPTDLYPPHIVRSGIVQTQLTLSLEKLERTKSSLGIGPILHAVVAGMAQANVLANNLKLAELPIDAQAFADRWVKEDAPAVNALEELLKSYLP
jgi:hypothetical protein